MDTENRDIYFKESCHGEQRTQTLARGYARPSECSLLCL